MIQLAEKLGWLSPSDMRAELMRMVGDLVRRDAVGAAEVDMICALNKDHALDQERHRLSLSPAEAARVANAAVLGCLGSAEGRARVLQALTDGDDAEVRIAEVFLAHRPIDDVGELRDVASGIARMTGSSAQVRALDTLGASPLERSPEPRRARPPLPGHPIGRRAAGHRRRLHPLRLSIAAEVRNGQHAEPAPAEVDRRHDAIDILIRRLQAP